MSEDLTPEQMMAAFVQHSTALLGIAVPVPPQQLADAIVAEMQIQPSYEPVLGDVIDPEKREKYPLWGFFIRHSGSKQELTRVTIPKQLSPQSPQYASELANWLTTYTFATTPPARAAWRAIGYTVEFFQTKAPSPIITSAH